MDTDIIFHTPKSFNLGEYISLIFDTGNQQDNLLGSSTNKEIRSFEEQCILANLNGYKTVDVKKATSSMFNAKEYLLIPYKIHDKFWTFIPCFINKVSETSITLFSKLGLFCESTGFSIKNYRTYIQHNYNSYYDPWKIPQVFSDKVNKKLRSKSFLSKFPKYILKNIENDHVIIYNKKSNYPTTIQKFHLPHKFDLEVENLCPRDRKIFGSINSKIPKYWSDYTASNKYFSNYTYYAIDSEFYIDLDGILCGSISTSYLEHLTICPEFRLHLSKYK